MNICLWIWILFCNFCYTGANSKSGCAIDLRCNHKFKHAHWHTVIDCIVPISTYLERANTARQRVCIDYDTMSWAQILAPNATYVLHSKDPHLRAPKNTHGHRGPQQLSDCTCTEEAPANHGMSTELANRAPQIAALRRLEVASAGHSHLSHTASAPIVYINRTTTRRLANDKRIVNALSRVAPVRVYQGTESRSDTIAIFRDAALIVGFHGAGFVNTLFSRREPVYLYEWSAYKDANNTQEWRANSRQLVFWTSPNSQMIAKVAWLPFQQVVKNAKVQGDPFGHIDIDHHIKDLEWIHPTDEDVERVVAYARQIKNITSTGTSVFPHTRDGEALDATAGSSSAACTQKSQSQDGEEDILIKHFFSDKIGGKYVEMGALDGVTFSNTLKLHKCLQWNGLLLEGLESNFQKLKKNVVTRPTDRPGVEIRYGAVCAPPQTHVSFATGKVSATGGVLDEMSESFKKTWVKAHPKTKSVECRPMSTYLAKHAHIDFFSLDVEGAELVVLETIDFASTTVNMFMIELDRHNLERNYKVRQSLFNAGYIECLNVVKRSGLFIHNAGSPYKCPFNSTRVASPDEAK